MLKSAVNLIGRSLYGGGIKPLAEKEPADVAIVGLDTEYTSKGHELLSVQIATENAEAIWVTDKIDADSLARWVWSIDPDTKGHTLWICAYWSIAELQHFDVRAALTVREFARGSLDVTYHVDGEKVIIHDLARWYDFASLKKVAEGMGDKKLDWDTSEVTRETIKDPAFQRYAIHDARLAYKIANALRQSYMSDGVDIVSYSTAASASAAFFRSRISERMFCDKTVARKTAALGCWGGRAEVFRRGKLPVHQEHDITGAYPSAAVSIKQFPVQGSWHECDSVKCLVKDRGGFAHVAYKWPEETEFPCLMAIDEKSRMAIFPLEGECVCTSYEIALAVENGCDVKIISAVGYRHGDSALSDYLAECSERRKQSTGADKQKYKLGMNSLIGKFFQRSRRLPVSMLYDLRDKLGVSLDELAAMSRQELQALADKEETVNLGPVWMPEWAGLITGFTRAVLGRAIFKFHPAYVHTDSIWVEGRHDPLPGWDIKGEGTVTVVRTRFAALWDEKPHIAHHSVHDRKVAEKVLREWDGESIVTRRYGKSRPLHIREALRRHDRYGRWTHDKDPGFFHDTDTRWDQKRVLLPSGHTRPWRSLFERQQVIDREGKRP